MAAVKGPLQPSQLVPVLEPPTPQVGTRDKSVGWYTPTIDTLAPAVRDLLENYSKIAPDRVLSHIHEVRDKAWEIFPYPCVGQFRFLDLSLSRTNSYSLILSRLQNGHKLLDLGCCFAQDLRKLVYDGAPAESLIGAELKSEFLALSYNLFLDKEIFGVPLIEADVFDVDNGAPLKPLEGKLDIVQIGLFLHLFDWEDQIRACERIVALLKAEKGSLVVGQQIGSTEPGEVPKGTGGMMFKHDADSFERLWREVGEKTKSQWEVRATLDAGLGIGEKKRLWDDSKTRRLIFEVERIE